MAANDEPDGVAGDDGFHEDIDEIEDLDELDDERFDPESEEDDLEPSIEDALVDEDELEAEDAVIELSLSEVAEEEAGHDEDAPVPDVEDDEDVLVRVVEDEDEEVEGLREGEFICSSCYLAKGPSQLADAQRQICVDCI